MSYTVSTFSGKDDEDVYQWIRELHDAAYDRKSGSEDKDKMKSLAIAHAAGDAAELLEYKRDRPWDQLKEELRKAFANTENRWKPVPCKSCHMSGGHAKSKLQASYVAYSHSAYTYNSMPNAIRGHPLFMSYLDEARFE